MTASSNSAIKTIYKSHSTNAMTEDAWCQRKKTNQIYRTPCIFRLKRAMSLKWPISASLRLHNTAPFET